MPTTNARFSFRKENSMPTSDADAEWRAAVLEELSKIRELLERERLASGPRDREDLALVGVIAAASRGLVFTAAALWRRVDAGDVVLAERLAACDVENPKQLGKLLKRLEGHDAEGVRILRAGANREGTVWKAARVQE
jgi:hypothetical protein